MCVWLAKVAARTWIRVASRFAVLIQVAEDEAVAEGIGDAHVAAPGLFDDAGARGKTERLAEFPI